MTNEQRISLQAHGFDEMPTKRKSVHVFKVDEHLQMDIEKGNQTQNLVLSKEQATEMVSELFRVLITWEVRE